MTRLRHLAAAWSDMDLATPAERIAIAALLFGLLLLAAAVPE
jgi:hypothetical protein